MVGYDSLGSAIIKLRKAFKDDPQNPAVIQTIPKKGYRLIAPVEFSDDKPNSHPDTQTSKQQDAITDSARPVWLRLGLGLILIVILAVFGKWIYSPVSTELSDQPTIAVLPFTNMSNDPQQEYFSDGITSDLITDLANIERISVISRSSVFTYKNTDIELRTLKEELGVDYIVEGSVRKDKNKLRISARLINASNGVSLWADRFDATINDVFSVQDKVVDRIITSLEVKLTEQEKSRIAGTYTNSIAAYDTFLHGWQYFWRYTKEGNQQAREYYLKAIELDKGFARAYANLAVTYAFDYMNGWSENPEGSLKQAKYYSNKALELNDDLPQVQWAVGIVHTYSRDYDIAIKAAEKSIDQSPSFADGYGLLATVLNYAGKPNEARQVMEKAVKLNPRHPFIYKMIQGQIYFNLYKYETAAGYFTEALDRNPTAQEVRLWLAATYAHQNKSDEASWQLEQISSTGAKLSTEYIEQFIPINDPVLRKHMLDGLIKAGLKFNHDP